MTFHFATAILLLDTFKNVLRLQQKEGSLMQQTASATPSRQERRVRRTRAMILAGFIQLMQQNLWKIFPYGNWRIWLTSTAPPFICITPIFMTCSNRQKTVWWISSLPSSTRIMPTSPYRNFGQAGTVLCHSRRKSAALPCIDEPEWRYCLCSETRKADCRGRRENAPAALWRKDLDAQDLNYVTSFFLSGCVGMIDLWLQDGCQQSAQHMAELSMKLLHAGVQGITRRQLQ